MNLTVKSYSVCSLLSNAHEDFYFLLVICDGMHLLLSEPLLCLGSYLSLSLRQQSEPRSALVVLVPCAFSLGYEVVICSQAVRPANLALCVKTSFNFWRSAVLWASFTAPQTQNLGMSSWLVQQELGQDEQASHAGSWKQYHLLRNPLLAEEKVLEVFLL